METAPARSHILVMSYTAALLQSALLGLYIALTIAPLGAPFWAVCLGGVAVGPVLIVLWFGWLDRRDSKAGTTNPKT